KLASDMIHYMPEYVVKRVRATLKGMDIKLKKAKILVIGVTYKRDIKDLRQSPSLDIIDILQKKNINVAYHDPIIPYLKFNHFNLKSTDIKSEKTLKDFDCVIIATDHSAVDYKFLLKNAKLIFDTRNIYKDIVDRKVVKL
ncbi:MAG: UDP-N-acetyl-D-glucosamine dehydrogenase, partial [Candidatus Omnitrophica bacterium]|nr:UDP-N-acetyl-D-glucosamine dehydrogenase [Candidatus Omnitrophota bacterium]